MTDQSQKTKNEPISSTSPRTFTEELQVTGSQLVDRLKELIAQGNVRRLTIKDSATGRILIEVPLTIGVVGGSMFVFVAPFLAAITAIAGLVARIHITVERYEDPLDAVKETAHSVVEKVKDSTETK